MNPLPAFCSDFPFEQNNFHRGVLPIVNLEPKKFPNSIYEELPRGKFRVVRTAESETILVVPGKDDTDRCLLFVGCIGQNHAGRVRRFPL